MIFDAGEKRAAFPAAAEPRAFATWEDFSYAALAELNGVVEVQPDGTETVVINWSIDGSAFMLHPDPAVSEATVVENPIAAYFGGWDEYILVDGTPQCLSERCDARMNAGLTASTTTTTTSASPLSTGPMFFRLTDRARDEEFKCEGESNRCVSGTSTWFKNYFWGYFDAWASTRGQGDYQRECHRCWIFYECCTQSAIPDRVAVNGAAAYCDPWTFRYGESLLERFKDDRDSVTSGISWWVLTGGDRMAEFVSHTSADHVMTDVIGSVSTKTSAGIPPLCE